MAFKASIGKNRGHCQLEVRFPWIWRLADNHLWRQDTSTGGIILLYFFPGEGTLVDGDEIIRPQPGA